MDGRSTHLCLSIPMNSCSPTNAKTLRQKRVKIITSDSFFTDWISAPTIVFRPVQNRVHLVTCQLYTNVIRVQNSLQKQIFDSDYEVELFNSCFHVWQTAQVIVTPHTRDSHVRRLLVVTYLAIWRCASHNRCSLYDLTIWFTSDTSARVRLSFLKSNLNHVTVLWNQCITFILDPEWMCTRTYINFDTLICS